MTSASHPGGPPAEDAHSAPAHPGPAHPGPARPGSDRAASGRREELLELAYRYALVHGLADMSLRPLAKEIGSSPRVLLFLFGSKDDLIRNLLRRARAEELAAIDALRADRAGAGAPAADLATAVRQVWRWLSAPEHRTLLGLWIEAYARSLVDRDGPWAGFARQAVDDWLDLLASLQPPARRRSRRGEAERTALLTLLRGAMLDLLATGDVERIGRGLDQLIDALTGAR